MPLWTFRLQSGPATAAACDLAQVITLRWSDFKDGLFHVHRNRAYGSEGTTKTDTGRMVFPHPTVKSPARCTQSAALRPHREQSLWPTVNQQQQSWPRIDSSNGNRGYPLP